MTSRPTSHAARTKSLHLEECEYSTVQILWLTRRRVCSQWSCEMAGPATQSATRPPRQRLRSPRSPCAPLSPTLPHRFPRLGHKPRRRPRSRQGLPRRAYPTVWPPGCSSEVSPRKAGTGAEPLSTGGAAHCEAGSGQGHQGRARGHACEHPPPSMLTAPAGDNRPLRAAAQEHKRAAGPRSARPYHTPCTHRATATRLLHRPTGSKSALAPP